MMNTDMGRLGIGVVLAGVALIFAWMGYNLLMRALPSQPNPPPKKRQGLYWLPGAVIFSVAVLLFVLVVYEAFWHPHSKRATIEIKPSKDGPIVVEEVVLDAWPPVIDIHWTYNEDSLDKSKQDNRTATSNTSPRVPSVHPAEKKSRVARLPQPLPSETAKLSAIPAPDLLELARQRE